MQLLNGPKKARWKAIVVSSLVASACGFPFLAFDLSVLEQVLIVASMLSVGGLMFAAVTAYTMKSNEKSGKTVLQDKFENLEQVTGDKDEEPLQIRSDLLNSAKMFAMLTTPAGKRSSRKQMPIQVDQSDHGQVMVGLDENSMFNKKRGHKASSDSHHTQRARKT